MKNKISLQIICCLLALGATSLSIHAQNTFPLSGNVGIGTASPNHDLDVNGDVNISDAHALMMNDDSMLTHDVHGNLVLGISAGRSTGIGTQNTFIGDLAGNANVGGYYNTNIGFGAGQSNIGGNENTYVGNYAGALNEGVSNTLIGMGANANGVNGSFNTIVGHAAGANTNGSSNCFFGYNAGFDNTDGEVNTYFGYFAGGEPSISNATAIGYLAHAMFGSTMILGASDANAVKVGIGTSTPKYILDVTTAAPFKSKTAIGGTSHASNGTGVMGQCNTNSSAYGVHGSSTSGFAGYFNGNVVVTGTFLVTSDERLKQDVKPVNDVVSSLMKISPSTYTFKNEYADMNVSKGMQYGFLAQNMEKVFPELVVTAYDKMKDEDQPMEYKSVNYIGMIPILTAAIQQQQLQMETKDATIANQQQEIDALKNSIEEIKSAMQQCGITCFNDARKSSSAQLNENKLFQNVPNPANGSTTIQYSLKSDAANAKIEVSNINGRVIKSIPVSGSGEISVSTNDLSSGSYQYSLIIDGKKIDTKSMVIAK